MNIYIPTVTDIHVAANRLRPVVKKTALTPNARLSDCYGAEVLIKREDLQRVRSFKLRGAYNKIISLSAAEKDRGIVCASAGNHAQGVAFACATLGIGGTIFMPANTPIQKINQTQKYGHGAVEIKLIGESFDEAQYHAKVFQQLNQSVLVHPFDDPKIIEGQATVAVEILQASHKPIDYLLVPLGGGGLAAGVASYFHALSEHTKVIAVEPAGAAAMKTSIAKGKNVTLEAIDTFTDGAAVHRVGELAFSICSPLLDRVISVPEGLACSEILALYNEDGIIAEPAGALSIAALEILGPEIRGKTVACVLSGGNNDIARIEEIKRRSEHYQNQNILAAC